MKRTLPLGLGAIAGVLATLGMDVVGFTALKAGAPMPPHAAFIGRWFMHLLHGNFVHDTIVQSPALAGENVIFPFMHYLIGATLGVVFVLGRRVVPGPIWLLGAGYGVLTCALPWLIMFPSMGFGLFGLQGPDGAKLIAAPLAGHLIFGFGVALWTTVLARRAR